MTIDRKSLEPRGRLSSELNSFVRPEQVHIQGEK